MKNEFAAFLQELDKLFKDLQELVSLYEDLVEIRSRTEPKKRRLNEYDHEERSSFVDNNHVTGNTTEIPVICSTVNQQQVIPSVTVDLTNLKSLLNRCCYAYYEGTLYTATVVDVHPTESDEVSISNNCVSKDSFLTPFLRLGSSESNSSIHRLGKS